MPKHKYQVTVIAHSVYTTIVEAESAKEAGSILKNQTRQITDQLPGSTSVWVDYKDVKRIEEEAELQTSPHE